MFRESDSSNPERQSNRPRGSRGGRYNDKSHSNAKPSYRSNARDLDKDWVHDRYEDDRYTRGDTRDRRSRKPEPDERLEARDDSLIPENGARLRVDNLHYDLTEQDLRELFTRIGPVHTVSILYDRSDRSRGTAFITYLSSRDADDAVREFDGANAYGQPIKLTLMPAGPSGRALASRVETRGRSLFERIENGHSSSGPRRGRSESPPRDRRSEVLREGTPDGIDRYVPGPDRQRQARSRSPVSSRSRRPPRNAAGSATRRDDRRGGGRGRGGGARDVEGRTVVGGRPRKTQQELDAEMEDYWGSGTIAGDGASATVVSSEPVSIAVNANVGMTDVNAGGGNPGIPPAAVPTTNTDDDIDMIE